MMAAQASNARNHSDLRAGYYESKRPSFESFFNHPLTKKNSEKVLPSTMMNVSLFKDKKKRCLPAGGTLIKMN